MLNVNLIVALFLLIIGGPQPDNQQNNLFTEQEINSANTAAEAAWMSEEEKNVILYMNLARMDGRRFYRSFINDYLKRHNEIYIPIKRDNPYLQSLKTDLWNLKDNPMLQPDSLLCMAAAFHAKDMGDNGLVGHNSSDGTDFGDRLDNFTEKCPFAAENCSYGPSVGIDIVCDLLIDKNVASLGHRINILNPKYKAAGVSIRFHQVYRYNCVIDFCGTWDD